MFILSHPQVLDELFGLTQLGFGGVTVIHLRVDLVPLSDYVQQAYVDPFAGKSP